MAGSVATQTCWDVCVALALLVACALSQEAVKDADSGFDPDSLTDEQLRALHLKMDFDGSGGISVDEALQYSDQMRKHIASKDVMNVLRDLDANKDGGVSLEEMLKDMEHWDKGGENNKEFVSLRSHEEEKFALADADKNGVLDKEELPGLYYPEIHAGVLDLTAKETMYHKDVDKDGFLTPTEFWEVHGDEQLGISPDEETDFKKLDKDSSGTLDLVELKAWESGHFHAREAFEKLMEIADKDQDGYTTAAELMTARRALAGTDAHYHLLEWAEHQDL